MFMGPCIVIVF